MSLGLQSMGLPAAGSAGDKPAQSPRTQIARDAYLMGTAATLVTWSHDRRAGLARLEAMLQILEDTEAELSTWRDDTPLARLNRVPAGVEVDVPPGLCALFGTLAFWERETHGAFDPALGRLLDVWGIRGHARQPGFREITNARRNSGWRHVVFDPEACILRKRRPVVLEEGAFGKGAALDRVRTAVGASCTADPWMIDLGGQVLVCGAPPGRTGWTVGLAHPARRDTALAEVTLTDGSLATSGGSERDQQVAGARVSHILDPRTGRPAPASGAVVVWREVALEADIISTALYVMGPEAGIQWANAREVAACFFVPLPGPSEGRANAHASRAFRARFPGIWSRSADSGSGSCPPSRRRGITPIGS